MTSSKQVAALGGFDDIRSEQIRFLEEASKLGEVTVLVWTDQALRSRTGAEPKFPLPERLYFLSAVRYVKAAVPVEETPQPAQLPQVDGFSPDMWVDQSCPENAAREAACRGCGLDYRLILPERLRGFPVARIEPGDSSRKKVIVTGCYDWFHSGHIRFFEEVSSYGDLYVILGHDANIRLLKGEGHPMVPEDERRYVVGSIRYVKQSLIATGHGWLDAEPDIERLKPDIYAVNEDGDRGGKREYCEKHGIQYLVLKRIPAPGLPKRTSTDLRGF